MAIAVVRLGKISLLVVEIYQLCGTEFCNKSLSLARNRLLTNIVLDVEEQEDNAIV